MRWQILMDVGGVPIHGDATQFFSFVVEKIHFLGGEFGRRQGEQFVPVGLAGKQVAVPPHRAGVDGIALGLRHGRHDAAEPGEGGAADQRAAQCRNV